MTGLGKLLWASAIAAAAAAALTPVAMHAARRLAILDEPTRIKRHARATPLLGGLSVTAGALCPVLTLAEAPDTGWRSLWPIALGLSVILVAGLLDDLRPLRPASKLGWQLAAAAVVSIGLHSTHPAAEGPVLGVLVTSMWVVAVINATNFLDNMDGLCAGIGAIAALALAVCLWRAGEPTLALAAAALGGACLGFLPYNWPRARIFLGDTGAMAVGLSLAAFSVVGVRASDTDGPVYTGVLPLMILALPILDLLLVVVLRLRAGHPIWLGDRRHMNHRLVRRGLAPAAAVPVVWGASALCAVVALLLPVIEGPAAAAAGLAALLGILGALTFGAGARGLS